MNDFEAIFAKRPGLLVVVLALAVGFAYVHQRNTAAKAAPPGVVSPPPMGQTGSPAPGEAFATTSELAAQRAAIEAWVTQTYGPAMPNPNVPTPYDGGPDAPP